MSNWAVTSARASVVVPQAPQLALARVTAHLDTNGGMFSIPIETFRNDIPIRIAIFLDKIRCKKRERESCAEQSQLAVFPFQNV